MQELCERYLAAKRRLFKKYYGAKLNDRQCEAVCAERGPVLVLAGAGSGKTTVLVRRIVHLIRYGDAYSNTDIPEGLTEDFVQGMEMCADSDAVGTEELADLLSAFTHEPCPPWGMLAITFTNKAAAEIRARLDSAFGDPAVSADIWAGTFHSVSLRILRSHTEEAGYRSGFSIYDTDDQKRIVSEVMKDLKIDDKVLAIRDVMREIGEEKNNLRTPAEFEDHGDFRRRLVGRVYAAYQKRLESSNALDFDDIIMKTVMLLEDHREVAEKYCRKFRYVCIDEYQDTNYAQFRLSELLSAGQRNIMVVGDDDQSIYRFRGATVENILDFDKTYPDAHVIKLEQNYRSTKTILAAANAVISNNSTRHDKHLWCDGDEGAKITLHKSDNQNDEATWIKDRILRTILEEKCHYSDMAILYRVNELSRALEAALAKSGIPYRIFGGQRFYDRKEIRDMVAYLHIVANPTDDLRLTRIINEPKRKIGDTTIEAVAAIAAAEGLSMNAVLEKAGEYPDLSKSAARLLDFAALLTSFRKFEGDLSSLIEHIFERSGYHAMLAAEGETGKTRIDHVEELRSAAAEYEKRAGDEASLIGFLEEISLISDIDKYDENADAVALMTIHSAKGLEFPIVFLPGMEENIFPGSQSRTDPSELAEERRLAYVAITRAKRKLYMSHTKERLMYGRTSFNPLSRFVQSELPQQLIEEDKPRPRPQHTAQPQRPQQPRLSGEFMRRPVTTSAATPPRPATAESFKQGDRVRHSVFGEGTVLTARPMGGDTLYEVKFDNGQVKKLMATYAKLSRA